MFLRSTKRWYKPKPKVFSGLAFTSWVISILSQRHSVAAVFPWFLMPCTREAKHCNPDTHCKPNAKKDWDVKYWSTLGYQFGASGGKLYRQHLCDLCALYTFLRHILLNGQGEWCLPICPLFTLYIYVIRGIKNRTDKIYWDIDKSYSEEHRLLVP